MVKFTFAEALVCLGLTAALFFSGGPASRLLDPDFYRETSARAESYSLAYQVLGYHASAPAFPIRHEPAPKALPAERAEAKVKAIGRTMWSTVARPFARPHAAEPQ